MSVYPRVRRVGASGILLAAAVACAHAAASPRVYRCVGQQGEIVFSGLPCAANASTDAGAATAAPDTPACAASRDELESRIRAAIARRDANALAGMLHWRGVAASAAAQRLRALRELVERPLLAIDADDVADEDGATAAATGDGVRVRTGGADAGGVREHVFGVSAEGACYWLTW